MPNSGRRFSLHSALERSKVNFIHTLHLHSMFQINIEPGEEFLPKCLQQILDNSELVTNDPY